MSQKEMFTISENIFKLLREHIQENKCDDNCCIERLLQSLELEKK